MARNVEDTPSLPCRLGSALHDLRMQDLVLLNVGLLDGLLGVAGIIFMIVIIDHSPIPQKKHH